MLVHSAQPFTVAGLIHSYEGTIVLCTYNQLSALVSFNGSNTEGDGDIPIACSEE